MENKLIDSENIVIEKVEEKEPTFVKPEFTLKSLKMISFNKLDYKVNNNKSAVYE